MLFLIVIISTFLLTCTTFAQTVTGVRTIGTGSPGSTLDNTINIDVDETNAPNALVVDEFIPGGWVVNSTSPVASSIMNGKISWLFFGAVSDVIVGYQLSVPVGAEGSYSFIGSLDYNDPANGGVPTSTPVTGDAEICMSAEASVSGDPSGYMFLQDAYDNAGNDDIIMVRNGVFSEDLFIDMNKTVFMEGGYDCDYLSNLGVTAINGNAMITDGKLIVRSGTFIIL